MKSRLAYLVKITAVQVVRGCVATVGLSTLMAIRLTRLAFTPPMTPEEIERRDREAKIDEALKESFPASDPPSPACYHPSLGG